VSAFTPRQIEILQAAFTHVWTRMAQLHDDLNDDSSRVATLLSLLVQRGILTGEQFDAALESLEVTVGLETGLQTLGEQRVTEEAITAEILRGDVEAFKRRQAEEE